MRLWDILKGLLFRECEFCKHRGKDVDWVSDPFNVEIYQDYKKYWICDKCAEQSALEI